MNNLDKMYNYYQKIDKDGWEELKVVRKYIKGDLYGNFPYEDNRGYFEFINGKEFIEWYEKMEFSNIINSRFVGAYEECDYDEPWKNKRYKEYKEAVKKDFVKTMDAKHSLQL